MKLLRGAKGFVQLKEGVVATIGSFDGVHLGHQNLIQILRDKANEMNLPLVLILFEPQPREYFQQESAPARLSNLREKLDKLRELDVDYVYCIKFNKQLAQTLASDFISTYLFRLLNVRYLLVGEDFRFGKNRAGDVKLLKDMSSHAQCEVAVYSDFCLDTERVSSTKVRFALQQGDLVKAAKLLGRTYSLCGRVIRGDGRGRQWGIPTANIGPRRFSFPLSGVFVVHVQLPTRLVFGVANIGRRPTVDGTKNVLEIHLLDFTESIYGDLVKVFFLHKLRDEVKFTSVDALIAQINKDIEATRAFLDLNPLKFNDFVE